MNLMLRFCLIISVIMGTQAVWTMDFSDTTFPQELLERILAVVGNKHNQEAHIREKVGLRRVCTRWAVLLIDSFIAGAVGIPQRAEDVQMALWQAIQDENSKTIELICKTHPNVIQGLQDMPLFLVPSRDHPNTSSYHRYFPRAVKILLSHRLNPAVTVWEIEPNGSKRAGFYDKLSSVLVVNFGSQEARECIDSLLEHATETDKSQMFLNALSFPNIYVLAKLINYCSPEPEDADIICTRLLGYYGACCQTHLRPLMEKLIRRGAREELRIYLQYHPQVCSYQNTGLPSDPLTAPLLQKPTAQKWVYSTWTSKIPYLIGAGLGCCMLYKYWWTPEEEDTDDEEVEDTEDVAESNADIR